MAKAWVRNFLLVIGALVLVFGFAELVILPRVDIYSIILGREIPRDGEIRTPEDARRLSDRSDRSGELARFTLDWLRAHPLDRTPYPRASLALKMEIPEYAPSSRRRPLWVRANELQANLDDDYVVRGKASGKTKYQAHYTTDAFGRRKTPAGKLPRSVVFLGCSFTFGQGVNDEASFPYRFGEKTKLATFNRGVPGYSPSAALLQLRDQRDRFLGPIPDQETTVIFTLIPEHVHRIIGTASLFFFGFGAFNYQPYVSLENGELVVRKTFSEDPTGRKHLHHFISRFRTPFLFGYDAPGIGAEELDLISRLFRGIEADLKAHYPQVRRVLYAFFPTGHYRKLFTDLRDTLLREKIEILDYTPIVAPALFGEKFFLEFDGHPSPLAYDFYSDLLIHDLKKKGYL